MREFIRRLFRFPPDPKEGINVNMRTCIMYRPKTWDAYASYQVDDEPFEGSVPVLMIELKNDTQP